MSVDAELSIPEKKTFWQKIGLAKVSPQKLSYFVCGEECAAEARANSNGYLVKVLSGRAESR